MGTGRTAISLLRQPEFLQVSDPLSPVGLAHVLGGVLEEEVVKVAHQVVQLARGEISHAGEVPDLGIRSFPILLQLMSVFKPILEGLERNPSFRFCVVF